MAYLLMKSKLEARADNPALALRDESSVSERWSIQQYKHKTLKKHESKSYVSNLFTTNKSN